jgi:hypothetical protein
MVGFIDEQQERFGVEPIYAVLPIAPSLYYELKAREREPQHGLVRARRDEALGVRGALTFLTCPGAARRMQAQPLWMHLTPGTHEWGCNEATPPAVPPTAPRAAEARVHRRRFREELVGDRHARRFRDRLCPRGTDEHPCRVDRPPCTRVRRSGEWARASCSALLSTLAIRLSVFTDPRVLDAMGHLRHSRKRPTRNALPMPGGKWHVAARSLHALMFAGGEERPLRAMVIPRRAMKGALRPRGYSVSNRIAR